ncbi:MAG: DUF4388 domain-containing protein [Acidobacteria bacterium]|nr:DUF4388 domain-containing protein [Acidobacteriota bacterium]NIM61127.1 DUF4388 domain-containing protein [Acidobacteriota bacterium]NIO58717.1 DUF4388 domain-containing protein [Acidobacteriota bacterium]NIQ29768.1 DUF4388 domain-containing protein [Acidobacteriota bacterium]NIQ84488.1 DUF4388 domain-containing protein [Acidobacteriota bacterium]
MNTSQDGGFSVGLQAGRLEGLALPDLLWALCRARKTGLIHFKYKDAHKTVYLDDGRIVFAASNKTDDRLGELLLRQGRITLAQLEQSVSQMHSGKRIGTLLVENGALPAEHLVDGVLLQVKRIVLDLFAWEEGEYHFEEGPLPTDELITLNVSTGELLLSGIRSIRSFARIRRSVGTPRTMYRLREDWRDALEGVRLSEGEELLVVRLEQGDESVEGLCREVFLSNFEIYQTLWGLKVLGLIEEKPSLAESGDAEWQGSLAEVHFADVLIGVAQRGATGILHVSRRMRERTFHFQEGRCVFATSNDGDDGLIAYLLRRGVISLHDREETAKRMLSNKRVGTILRELGVIDDRDLDEMVRQQLSEVVYDTFRWDDGDFAFYVGELPTHEEIMLEASIESLVAEGIRRVVSWSRVMEGCAGMDHRLSLSESYLDVLDGLDAGAEEWKVINALKDPLPAREVADGVDLPDFRVCQILWTLRVLNAIELSSLDARVVEERRPAESIPVDVVDLDTEPVVAEEPAEEPVPVHVAGEIPDADDEPDEDTAPGEAFEAEELEATEEVEAAEDAELEDVGIEAAEEEPVEDASTEIPLDEESDEQVEIEVQHGEVEEPAPLGAGADETLDAARVALEEQAEEQEEVDVEVVGANGDTEADADTPIEDPHLRELEESTRTMRLSREEVDAAIQTPPEDESDEAGGWEPPADLEQSIACFNAMQRLIYRTVRSEVGAGAANFIRACADEKSQNVIEGAELQSDGTWDNEGLRRQVVEHRIEEPWELYRQLIDRELDVLRAHIGEAKIVELQREVAKVSETHAP